MITTKDLCKILNVDRATLLRWRRKGMPFIKVERTVRYELDSVLEWVKVGTVEK